MSIDAARLDAIFAACLLNDEEAALPPELKPTPIIIDGVIRQFGIHPERYKEYAAEIGAMLDQLDPTFHDGWSFLNMPFDKNGEQWGEQLNAEQLVVLGTALGRVSCVLPREMWSVLPGGMPYYTVKEA